MSCYVIFPLELLEINGTDSRNWHFPSSSSHIVPKSLLLLLWDNQIMARPCLKKCVIAGPQ